MSIKSTALIMLGMQRDHFAHGSPLHGLLEDSAVVASVRENAIMAARRVHHDGGKVMHVPIQFAPGYPEIPETPGILAAIRDLELFHPGSSGAEDIDELRELDAFLLTLQGRRGFNAFCGSGLDEQLSSQRIRRLLLAGATGSTSIDSTARMAYELGYEVVVLEDCVLFRSSVERSVLCNSVFPQYAVTSSASEFLRHTG